ncbi:MAG: penicillin-binding transpeptidase domain-containing protein [Clostridia bacterium]|nr:penicillin-binding transpeptidase domain-containing protein [Clostridia bacterium]
MPSRSVNARKAYRRAAPGRQIHNRNVSGVSVSPVVIRARAYRVIVLVTLLFLALVLRLAWIQIVKSPFYTKLALDQRMRPVPVEARRGTIYDRQRRELAVSISADSVYAAPADVRDPSDAAKKLSTLLGVAEETLLKNLTARQQTVWLRRKVEHDVADAVKKLGLSGIGVVESGQRFYPKDTLAAQVIGIAGIDNQGLEGIEQYYDSQLRGVRGQIVAERDAAGREIEGGRQSRIPPVDGNSIVLTIDEVIQFICERELDRALVDTGASRGLILAMDPRTSEVLGMAIRPTFNPNNYAQYPGANRRNFAICDMYEPGSTFKVVTAAASLEEGVVTPNTMFFDPGFIKVEDRTMKCWKAGGHGSQTFTQATENSCNPVFASIALKLGTEKFLQYVRAMGLSERTGIDFPGEAAGITHQVKKIGPVELATYGFGQGISVTPLQLLNAMCAIANGGALMKPMLVREVLSPEGEVIQRFQPTKIRQAVSAKTASELSTILQSVVVNGSGSRAAVPGYAVAGKTGTAQKPERGGYGEKRVASFMGFAPANDPRIAILVVLDEPTVDVKYGGVIAAPIFKAAMEDALRYLELPPTYGPTGSSVKKTVTVPNVVGKSADDANSILSAAKLSTRAEGSGSVATEQTPKAGARVDAGTTVVVYFTPAERYNPDDAEVEVPDVIGRTLKDAALLLGARGLSVNPVGKGLVVREEPAAGTVVKADTMVTIYLED